MRLLSFILLCLLAFSAFGDGLVVEYKFDNSLIDTGSDGDITDTLTASSPVYENGLFENSLYCDSSDCAAADSCDLDLTPQYTIEAFIKPYLLSGVQTVLSKASYKIVISGSNLGFFHTQSNGTVIGDYSVPLTLNKWQHIAVIANGSLITLYLNGKCAATYVYNGTILNSSSALSIGSSYKGLVDEVRIFNYARTSDYVYSRSQYNCGDLPAEDIDGDCRITFDDLCILAGQWLLGQ